MTRRKALSALSLNLLLALPAGSTAWAQTPAGLPRSNDTTSPSSLKSAAVDGQGNVTALFEHSTKHRIYGRRFSAAGTPLGPEFELKRAGLSPIVAANERGDSVILWDHFGGAGSGSAVLARLLRTGLPPLNLTVNRGGRAYFRLAGDIAIDRTGRFAVVWVESNGAFNRIHGERFNADGTRLGPEIVVDAPGSPFAPRIAMSHATGDFVIAWVSLVGGRPDRLLGQRFGFTSGPRGSVFQINSTDPEFLYDIDAAGADDGSFAVVWRNYRTDTGPADIVVEHFDAKGERSGGEVLADSTVRFGGGTRLAMAPEGHFVVVWEGANADEAFQARLYHGDGTPAGPVREIPGTTNAFNPEPAFGWNGTFVLVWLGHHQSFAASPGDETCLFRRGHFLCDTDPGGGAEIDHVFAVRSGTPALGDVDDDGRDDYCLFRGNRFDCDSGHDYGAAEFTAFFGQPGDAPVIGDLDRDGRDDVCVFRAGTFLCDSAHNGGAAETTLAFGQPGDLPALRDVNGDGWDEACVLRGSAFLCDTGHDGGAAETTLSAGEAGPLLRGNVDGL